jgi:hypothetical protein
MRVLVWHWTKAMMQHSGQKTNDSSMKSKATLFAGWSLYHYRIQRIRWFSSRIRPNERLRVRMVCENHPDSNKRWTMCSVWRECANNIELWKHLNTRNNLLQARSPRTDPRRMWAVLNGDGMRWSGRAGAVQRGLVVTAHLLRSSTLHLLEFPTF